MKKIVSLLLAFAMLFALVPLASAAGTATLSFTVSSSAPTVGNQISFKVNFTGANIGSYQYTLRYNPEVLEYIGFSGDGDCDGAGGAVTATGVFDNNVSSVSTTVTFKTKKVGSDTINLSNIVVVDGNDFQKMNISGSTSKTINVAAKPEASTDNTLKSLSVSPAGLTPAFATGTTRVTSPSLFTCQLIPFTFFPYRIRYPLSGFVWFITNRSQLSTVNIALKDGTIPLSLSRMQ